MRIHIGQADHENHATPNIVIDAEIFYSAARRACHGSSRLLVTNKSSRPSRPKTDDFTALFSVCGFPSLAYLRLRLALYIVV